MSQNTEDPKVIDITSVLKKRKETEKEKALEEDYPNLNDVAEVIVNLSLILDSIGYSHYGDKLSAVLEEMFLDQDIPPQDWGQDY